MTKKYLEFCSNNLTGGIPPHLRVDAEKILLESRETSEESYPQDVLKLIHELQVYQVELEIQNQELRKSQLELEISRNEYSNLFDMSPIGYLILDSNLLVRKANLAAAELLKLNKLDLILRTLSRFIIKEDADKFYLHCQEVKSSKKKKTCYLQFELLNGNIRVVELHTVTFLSETGEENFQVAISDITEQEEARQIKVTAEQQQLLMRELDHRVKNILCTVVSIMRQTIRSTFTFDTFRTAFEGRMMALAKVHELLMKNRWETLLLEDIINPVLQPYLGLKGPTISVSGPKVQLKSDTAQALHLIFHELTTNAVKYGALSVQTGHLNVFWETKQLEGGLNLQISWQESGGPEVVKPNKVGFGSQLIDRTISGKLSGEVNSEYYYSGFQWVASFLIK